MVEILNDAGLKWLCYKVWARSGQILESADKERATNPEIDGEGALLRALLWEIRWELELPAGERVRRGAERPAASYWRTIEELITRHSGPRLKKAHKKIIQEELIDRVLRKKAS